MVVRRFLCLAFTLLSCSPAREQVTPQRTEDPIELDAGTPDGAPTDVLTSAPSGADAGVLSFSTGGSSESGGVPTLPTDAGKPSNEADGSTLCTLDERLSDAGGCVPSDNWMVAEATVVTPDGAVYQLTALSERLALSCSSEDGGPSVCQLELAPKNWSDLDTEVAVEVLNDSPVTVAVAEVGTQDLGPCALSSLHDGSDFTTRDGSCSITVSDMFVSTNTGYVRGAFNAQAYVTPVGDAGVGVGILLLSGEFQVAF